MRIVHTPARFMPYIGGVESTVYYMSRELVRAGHSVRVICADEPAAPSGMQSGIDVVRLAYVCKIANTNITPMLLPRLLADDCDIIHSHLPCPWSADMSGFAAAVRNKPFFLNYVNDITGTGINRRIASAYNASFLKLLLRNATGIFVAHRALADSSAVLKPWMHKVRILPFGVDIDTYKPQAVSRLDKPNTLFFLSKLDRFHTYKGLEYLFKALRIVLQRMPVTLYLGGEGELAQYYKNMAAETGVAGSVVFLGLLTDRQVVDYYNGCDAFVLPSTSKVQEGWGLVAVEAMACGKPVITTDIVGMAQNIRDAGAGIVVKKEDPAALADAIMSLMSDRALRQNMGAAALKIAREKFSWGMYAAGLLHEYAKALR